MDFVHGLKSQFQQALHAFGEVQANIYGLHLVIKKHVEQSTVKETSYILTGRYGQHARMSPVETYHIELEHQLFHLEFKLHVFKRSVDISKTYHTRLTNRDHVNLTLSELGNLEKALENETKAISVPVRVPVIKMLKGSSLNQDDVKLPYNLPEIIYNHFYNSR